MTLVRLFTQSSAWRPFPHALTLHDRKLPDAVHVQQIGNMPGVFPAFTVNDGRSFYLVQDLQHFGLT